VRREWDAVVCPLEKKETQVKVMLTIPTAGAREEPTLADLLAAGREARADRGCVVNLVDGLVSDTIQPPPGLTSPAAIVEAWLHDGADYKSFAAPWTAFSGVAGYVIEECIQRPIPRSGKPEQTDGVTNIFLVGRTNPLSMEEFADHWKTIHGPLALRVHYGMSGYVQNIVWDRFLEVEPQVDGFSNLQFPSVDDSIHKMHVDEAGAAAVAADVASFVGMAVGYRCFEHVVAPVD
jgi:uncharacterized protein (TIGR02118 family)